MISGVPLASAVSFLCISARRRSAFCFLLAAQKVCIPFQCGLRHESHLLLPMLCSALWCYRVPITHYRPLLPAPRFNVTHACGGKVLRTHPYLQACKYGCAQVVYHRNTFLSHNGRSKNITVLKGKMLKKNRKAQKYDEYIQDGSRYIYMSKKYGVLERHCISESAYFCCTRLSHGNLVGGLPCGVSM